MLKDSIDFDYNLEQINQEIDPEIQLQDEIMDSEKMNNTFSTIESNLKDGIKIISSLNSGVKGIKSSSKRITLQGDLPTVSKLPII